MTRLLRLSLLAVVLGLLPLALALLGYAIWAMAACVNPPFAQPATGLCGVAETLQALIWFASLTLPLAVAGVIGVLVWSARKVLGR